MIEDPWIILVTDRGKLGSSIHAVAGKRKTATIEYRQTLNPLNAMGFPTERTATNWARRLLKAHPHDRVFTVVKLGPGDCPKPARDRVFDQLDFFDRFEAEGKPCRSARKTGNATRKIGRSALDSSGTTGPGIVASGARPKTASPTRSRRVASS